MSTSAVLPQKQDVPKEIWKIASTLTNEAQEAAVKKAQELGFDINNKGRLSLEETLINLSDARDVLIDAVEKEKLPQLPLKLQYTLLAQADSVSKDLTALTNGTDATAVLENSVDELNSTIWQFNLRNLSGEVLGLTQKMNQLKSQETKIREIYRIAQKFESMNERAAQIVAQLESAAQHGEISRTHLTDRRAEIDAGTKEVMQIEAQLKAVLNQAQEQAAHIAVLDGTSRRLAEESSNAKAFAEASAAEANTTTAALNALLKDYTTQLPAHTQAFEEGLSNIQNRCDELVAKTDRSVVDAQQHLSDTITEAIASSTSEMAKAQELLTKEGGEMKGLLRSLIADTANDIATSEKEHKAAISTALSMFKASAAETLEESSESFAARLKEVDADAKSSLALSEQEFKRLTNDLDVLEGRIRESIERATGYTLFHSFQKRQLDLANSKMFWAKALAGAVLVSLCASGAFIYSLRFVTNYNAAFYLKLSISLPLIYAIAFCSIQYSRERRLEEEYAFKSNISISLDPYQKLVGQLVKQDNPEELAKYTEFMISSVNKVFTSPTESVFDGPRRDDNSSSERVIKALGDFVKPLAEVITKK